MSELMNNELTPKEQLFVSYYLANNMNSTKAAKLAGYSEASAYELGSRLLKKVEIKKAIDQYLQSESLEALELLKRLSDIARGKGSEYFNSDGSVDLESMKQDGMMHVVKSTRKHKGKVYVTFHDSMKALEQLAKVHKLINDNPTVTVNLQNEIDVRKQLDDKFKAIAAKLDETNYVMG